MLRNPTMLQERSPSPKFGPPGLVDNMPLRDCINYREQRRQSCNRHTAAVPAEIKIHLESERTHHHLPSLKASAAASDPACDNDGEEDRRPGPTTPSMEAAPVTELQWMTSIQSPQPDTQLIAEDQLINEVCRIYAGLIMAENKCIEGDKQHTESLNNLLGHRWQALISCTQPCSMSTMTSFSSRSTVCESGFETVI